ncbi:MAG: hypothetical protein V7K42_13805 [Nostoc sp.]
MKDSSFRQKLIEAVKARVPPDDDSNIIILRTAVSTRIHLKHFA